MTTPDSTGTDPDHPQVEPIMNIRARWPSGHDAAPAIDRLVINTPPARPAAPVGKAVAALLAGLLALWRLPDAHPCLAAQTTAGVQANAATSLAANLAASLPAWPVLRQGSNNQWPPVAQYSRAQIGGAPPGEPAAGTPDTSGGAATSDDGDRVIAPSGHAPPMTS